MTKELGTLILELPPTLNQSYRVLRFGQRAGIGLTPEAKAWKELIAWEARSKFGAVHPRGTYELRLVQHLNKNSRDVDGNVKLVMDGVADGIGINDNRFFRVELIKVIDGKGYLEICLLQEVGAETLI
jgi:Holliday junction resolvase RusA-like endonuclease